MAIMLRDLVIPALGLESTLPIPQLIRLGALIVVHDDNKLYSRFIVIFSRNLSMDSETPRSLAGSEETLLSVSIVSLRNQCDGCIRPPL
jgi:hypothetical protein